MDDLAGLHDIAEVCRLQRRARVLFDQQDRHAEIAQRGDDPEDFARDQRRQPQARLVQHQKLRLRHQRATDGEHLPLTARERAGMLPTALAQLREAVEHIVNGAADIARPAAAVGAKQQVVGDGHFGEQLAPLGHQAEAHFDAAFGRFA